MSKSICWVNGEKCPYGFNSLQDSKIGYCNTCKSFSSKDNENRLKVLGFTMKDPYLLFTEEQLYSLGDNKELLNVILITLVNEVKEHFVQVREIRKFFLRVKYPNISEKGLEETVETDSIFCEMEDYLQELELLGEIFEE